jgi:hypothetical protein
VLQVVAGMLLWRAAAQSTPQVFATNSVEGLRLAVTGDPTTAYRVEASLDLKTWDPLALTGPSRGVVPASGQFELLDRTLLFGGQRFYRAVQASQPLTTNSGPGIVVSDPTLTLYQGSSNSFTVWLASAPASPVAVQANPDAGNTNISVSVGGSLLFGPDNWSAPQTVTISAGQCSDFADSLATLVLSATNLASSVVRIRAVNSDVEDEFVGPFASWLDLKRDFGAQGDGTTDDTAALQQALYTLHYTNAAAALFVPAGTYRITQTLDFHRTSPPDPVQGPHNIMIVGADPARTTFLWGGESNSVMIAYGAWYTKLSRLTFDGAGKAKTALAHDTWYSSHNEFSELVFTDLGFGIQTAQAAGIGNAESVVERCRFVRCSQAGVSIENLNSLDWFVWNSEFDDCAVGVGNIYGGGNFHVYESLFERSTQADIAIGNTGYFSARNNTSIGSAAFFTAAPIASCGLLTLQGNTVVQPQGVPLQLGDLGPVMLLDNWIEDYQGLVGNIEPSAAFFSVGNTFTVSNAIPTGFYGPAGIRLDDVVTLQKIPISLPKLPGALPNLRRQVFDLGGPTNAAGIQAAINQAAASGATRPIVHLPAGDYSVAQTIQIPAGSDVQVVGDGYKTVLQWTGAGTGPVLHLAGPSRATLRDFALFGGVAGVTNPLPADGILIDNCDQPGARIYGDQMHVYYCHELGVSVEGLTNAKVELANFFHTYNGVSVRAQGGGNRPISDDPAGQVSIFGGFAALNGLTYDVEKWGRLLVRDSWYEAALTNSSPRFMLCTNSGVFTLQGGEIAPSQSKTNIPVVDVRNFTGRLTLLATQFGYTNTTVSVAGPGTNAAVVLANTVNLNLPNFNAPNGRCSFLQSFQTSDFNSFNPQLDVGPRDENFLRQMLAQTRLSRPAALSPTPTGTTDLRMHRLYLEVCNVGIRLTK